MPEPRHQANRPNRVWGYTWRICATLFAITFLTLLACSFDDEPLDTSALRYEPRQIHDSENAYLVIEEAAKRLGKLDIERPQIYRALRGENWNDEVASEWLRDREFVIETIESMSRVQTAQLHLCGNILEAYGRERPDVDWVGFLACIRARQLLLRGELQSAFQLQTACWHAADLICDCRGDLLSWIHGRNMEFAALEVAYELASNPALDDQSLRLLIKRTRSSYHSQTEFKQLVARNFLTTRLALKAFTGSPEEQIFVGATGATATAYRLPFLFKPNQSLNYVIPHFEDIQARIDLSIPESKAFSAQHPLDAPDLCDQYDDWINHLGKKAAHDYLAPTFGGMLKTRLVQQTRLSLAETLIALRLYHDAHDRQLPATLADLVPAYLPAVPRDYFDGEPIKYSRDLRAIWSVGPEGNFQLTDADQAVHERELILPLCFDGSYAPWPRRDPQAVSFGGYVDSPEPAASQ